MSAKLVHALLFVAAALGLLALGTSVLSALPGALAGDSADLPNVMAWGAAVAVGVALLVASVALRAAGKPRAAAIIAAIVAVPILIGLGVLLLIVLLFILKGL